MTLVPVDAEQSVIDELSSLMAYTPWTIAHRNLAADPFPGANPTVNGATMVQDLPAASIVSGTGARITAPANGIADSGGIIWRGGPGPLLTHSFYVRAITPGQYTLLYRGGRQSFTLVEGEVKRFFRAATAPVLDNLYIVRGVGLKDTVTTWEVDGYLVEEGDTTASLGDYFDGNTPSDDVNLRSWDGAPGLSSSTHFTRSTIYGPTIGTRIPQSPPPAFLRVLSAGGRQRDLVTDTATIVLESFALRETDALRELNLAIARLQDAVEKRGKIGNATAYRLQVIGDPSNFPLGTLPSHKRYTSTLVADLRRQLITL